MIERKIIFLFTSAALLTYAISEECIQSGQECNLNGDDLYCCNPKERCVAKEEISNGTSGYVCSLPALRCQKNHFEKNRVCVPMVGAKCKKSQCQGLDHSVCRNRKCRCKIKHFASEDNKACHPYTLKIGGLCANNKSCEKIPFSECVENKCQCRDGYSLIDGKCLPGLRSMPCVHDGDCFHVNGLCISGVCDCFHEPSKSKFDDRCLPINFSDCSSEDPCVVKNSHCHPVFQKCLCEEGYISNLRGIACNERSTFKPPSHWNKPRTIL